MTDSWDQYWSFASAPEETGHCTIDSSSCSLLSYGPAAVFCGHITVPDIYHLYSVIISMGLLLNNGSRAAQTCYLLMINHVPRCMAMKPCQLCGVSVCPGLHLYICEIDGQKPKVALGCNGRSIKGWKNLNWAVTFVGHICRGILSKTVLWYQERS